jgi:DNA (cytosine-5)-methyltransferase 1
MRPRLLDLFCGAGGAAMGYHRAGFEVVGVDIAPQPNYPFAFHRADALAMLGSLIGRQAAGEANFFLGRIDAIHASPPCQAYSALGWHPQNRDIEHPDLVEPTRDLLQATGLPYVIENVVGAPLESPIMLCGSSFGLPIHRHRLFETNFPVMGPPCAHGAQAKRFEIWRHGERTMSAVVPVYGTGGGKAAEYWPEAMGIDWMSRYEMSQAIPPAFTEHLGQYLLTEVRLRQEAAA